VLIRLLRTFLARYRVQLLGLLGLQAIQALLNLYLPNLNANIVNLGIEKKNTHYIWHTGGTMLGVALVQAVFAVMAVYLGARIAMSFGRDVRDALFHRSMALSAREVNELSAPSLITRSTNDVQQVQIMVTMICTMALAAPVTIVGGIILALRQNAGLTWLLGVSMPLLVICLGFVISQMIPQFRLMQERLDKINQILREQIAGIRVVRAFVRERHERDRFETVNHQLTGTAIATGRLMALMFPVVMLIVNCANAAVVWFGANRIVHGQMSVGSLIAFLTYFTLILFSVMMATFVGVMAPRAAVSAERIEEVLNTEPSVKPPADPVTVMPTPGTLEFRGVSFAYPGAETPVLDDISFRSLPGETTAVIGSTGSGKTTLVNLVARLFDATSGSVLMGGVDVRDLSPDVLWQRIGLVPQRSYLFSGTVASNLRYGNPEATDEEMWASLEIAEAAGFVTSMGGLEARISQGGLNLSGGQRQRMSIARALARQPDVYIFDDSFSALDLATDARIRSSLVPYVTGSTVLIVAQRVGTILSADRIIVLEHGRAVGIGTHGELLRECPTYAEIVSSQMAEEVP
jgi:ATP-binding cassette, subfamily B, multidrug efflux pump